MDLMSSIVEQVRVASKKQNRLAMVLAFVLGSFVPCATYFVSHKDVNINPAFWVLVVGGLIFSAKTVYEWGKVAFQSGMKAFGFCLLVEGIMTFSNIQPLAIAALIVLCSINGIATGCILALNQREYISGKRRERKAQCKMPELSVQREQPLNRQKQKVG